jgi:multidrug resistance efflux pump
MDKSVGEVVSAKAVVVPYKEARLSFKAAGRVQKVLVSEGQVVAAGQELAKLETRDLEQAVRQAEAGLKSMQAQLARVKAGARPEEVTLAEAAVSIAQGNLAAAQATLSSAQANLDRLLAGPTRHDLEIAEKQVELAKNELWGLQKQRDVSWGVLDGQVAAAWSQVEIAQLQLEKLRAGARAEDIAIAKAQVAQAQAGVQTAEAQVRQAQAQLALVKAGSRAEDIAVAEAAVAQAEATLTAARNALEDAVLKAPFAGTIGAVLTAEGELASPQMPVIRLGDLTRLQVQTEDLSEVDVSRVKVGQEVAITVDALEGKVFQGQVARIAPVATDRRGDKVYAVTLDLAVSPEAGLRWGMSAFVQIKAAP